MDVITIKPGDNVAWKWGWGLATGVVLEVQPHRTEIESKGKLIVRNGTDTNPAVIIQHETGVLVLKLHSELQTTS